MPYGITHCYSFFCSLCLFHDVSSLCVFILVLLSLISAPLCSLPFNAAYTFVMREEKLLTYLLTCHPAAGDFPALTPAKAGTRFSDPRGMQG